MAVTQLCGFESSVDPTAANNDGEVIFGATAASVSFQSTTKHSGTYAMRVNPAGTTANVNFQIRDSSNVQVALYRSCRFFLRIATLPSANCRIAFCGSESLYLNTDGTLSVARGTTKDATSTNALSVDGLWHAIEWDTGWSSGNGRRVYVDGVSWASIGTTAATVGTTGSLGVVSDSCTADLYFDDVVWEDSTLASIWTDWKVLWMPVISDNNRGAWTGAAGGTTNLYDALDNIPPVAVADASGTNTTQIQSANNSGTDAYDANVQSYTTAGIGASDTIRAVHAVVVHAEGIATGTKTGDVSIVSNPAASARTFVYGRDTGASSSYPVNWTPAISLAVESPSVTLGTSPVVRVRKTDTGTREVHVAWLGLYVAYTPASGTVTPITPGGTLTSAGALAFRVNKPIGGTLTSAGALTRKPSVIYLGTLTSAGVPKLQANKPLAGTLTSSGALTARRIVVLAVAGTLTSAGTLVRKANQSLAGTLTMAGVLIRTVNQNLAGTLTTAGALVRKASRLLAGTLASSGALTTMKVAVLAVGGTLVSAGALVRKANQNLAGTLTTSGALIRTGSRLLGGTLTSTGTLVRRVSTSMGGTLTSSGALVRTASRLLAGTLTTTGALIRKVNTSMAGTLTTTGALIRQANIRLAGTLTTAGSLVAARVGAGVTSINVGGTLTSAGTLARKVNTSMGGTLTSSGALVRKAVRTLSGTLTTAGTLTAIKLAFRSFGGTLTTAGSLVRRANKAVGGTLTSSGTLVRKPIVRFTGTLTSAGNLIRTALRRLAGTLGLSGALSNQQFGSSPGVGTGDLTRVVVEGSLERVQVTGTLALVVTDGTLTPVVTEGSLVATQVSGELVRTPQAATTTDARELVTGTLRREG